MSNSYPSILNDILGPVMVGPSSSHTCGPTRIGYLSGKLVEGGVKRAEIIFARDGSFPNTYRGQRTDLGFIGGLLGMREYDPGLSGSLAEARRAGVSVKFLIEDHKPAQPNYTILRMWNDANAMTEVHADSTGGGTLRLMRIDGFDVDVQGDVHELVVFTDGGPAAKKAAKTVKGMYGGAEGFLALERVGAGLIDVKLRTPPSDDELRTIRALDGVIRVVVLEPVHPVLSNYAAAVPFASAAEIVEAARDGASLGELGVRYEMARAGLSQAELYERMDRVIDIMEKGAAKALSGDVRRHGILTPSSAGIAKSTAGLDLGVLNVAVPWAMGVMEVNSDMGVVVAGPTGGSAGVIPGAVLGVATRLGVSHEKKRLAMFAAGLAGIVIAAKGCNFSAELFGCQIEVGAASALAAAGLVELLGGTANQALDASATATHNILGLICDPVAGLVELPCISRNAMGVSNAAVSANLVLGGYDPLIGMDESAEVLIRVGRDMPPHHRCTGHGGLCACNTAYKLYDEQQERNNNR